MSLLCTFFILILTFSTIEREKFDKAKGSLQGALGILGIPNEKNISGITPVVNFDRNAEENLKTSFLKEKERHLERVEYLRKKDDQGLILDAELLEKGVRFRLKGDVLFDPVSAEVRSECLPFLSGAGNILAEGEIHVLVEGHTDSHFQPTLAFPTSLELSAARAAAVARCFLEEGLAPEHLKIAAYGKYRPAFPNDDPLSRAMNRRVDLTLFWKKGINEDG